TSTNWYLTDAIGSVRLTLDDAGVPVDPSGYSYTPFGIPLAAHSLMMFRHQHGLAPGL
ncbi:hypothetical protein HC928_08095, partial [bacterium]|nr:hypothetical protein [bacterium]